MKGRDMDIILVKLAVARIGAERQVKGSDVDEAMGRQVDKSFVKVTKRLFDCKEYDAAVKLGDEARKEVAKYAVPAPWVGKGFAMMKVEAWEPLVAALAVTREKLDTAVSTFAEVYLDRAREAQVELAKNGIPWNPTEYPSLDDVRNGFSIEWAPMAFDLPAALAGVSAKAFQEAKAEAEVRFENAMERAETALLAEVKGLVDRMVERLQPGEDGKPRIFRDSLVGNLREFLDTAPFRNVTDSAELDQVVSELRRLLGNETAEALRKSEGMRDIVRTGMEAVAEKLEACIVQAPARKILVFKPDAAERSDK